MCNKCSSCVKYSYNQHYSCNFSFLNSPVRNTEHIACNDLLTLSTRGEWYGEKIAVHFLERIRETTDAYSQRN